jgi:hypothetical protein
MWWLVAGMLAVAAVWPPASLFFNGQKSFSRVVVIAQPFLKMAFSVADFLTEPPLKMYF